MATIFLDDTSSRITYVNYLYPNVKWETMTSNSFVGGSVVEIQAPITLSIIFTGVSFQIFGLTISSVEMGVTIDNGSREKVTVLGAVTDTDRQTVWPWYKSPALSDSTHNVTLSDPALMLDYVLVTAGNDTPLRGERLLIDDGDSAITYTGNWKRNTSTLIGSDGYLRVPVGNSTRQSNETGATLSFTFTGTSVSLVGVCNYADDSSHVNIFLDDIEVPRRIPSVASIPDPTFVWYSTDSLVAGNHTIKVLVVDASPSPGRFTLDYILYTPSFDTLATKYSSTVDPATNSTSSTGTDTNPSTQTVGTTRNSTSISKGAIAGIAVSAAAAAIIILALLYRRWSLKRNNPTSSTSKDPSVKPFPLDGATTVQKDIAQQAMQEKTLIQSTQQYNSVMPISPSASMAPSTPTSSSILNQNANSPNHPHLEPFILPEYRENNAQDIAVQRKPRLQEKGNTPLSQGSRGNSEVLPTARPTPTGEGSSRTRVEHLRQLVVEIQREIAESDPTAAQEDGAFMREMLNTSPGIQNHQGEHYGDDHRSIPVTLPPPYEPDQRC